MLIRRCFAQLGMTSANKKKNYESPECFKQGRLAEDNIITDEASTQLVMEKCIMKSLPWLAGLHAPLEKCRTKTEEHNNQKEICQKKQGTFEGEFCTYALDLNNTCREQEVCRFAAISAQKDTNDTALTTESAIKADFKAAQKIMCFFKVFKANASSKSEIFESCKTLNVDVSQYNLTYYPIPRAIACDKETTQPCNAEWMLKEFQDQPWYSQAKTTKCNPCQVVPATTTTLPTTTVTTVVAWKGYRYVRINVTKGGTKDHYCFGGYGSRSYGFALYNVAGTRVKPTKVACTVCGRSYGDQALIGAFTSTKHWCVWSPTKDWRSTIDVDLGDAVDISRYAFNCGGATNCPVSWVIQTSKDQVQWLTADVRKDQSLVRGDHSYKVQVANM